MSASTIERPVRPELLVFNDKQPWPAVDLRVELDWHAVAKLRRLYTQTRRIDPMLAAMYQDPARTFEEYRVVYDIVNSQVQPYEQRIPRMKHGIRH